jgi:hypothetical protein
MKKKPLVAQFCTVLAWLSIVSGVFLVGVVLANLSTIQSGTASEPIMVGVALVCSAMVWFLGARLIVLLAQIESNTRR